MVSAVSEYRCVASGHRRMQSAACRHSTLTCKRVPRPAGTASPMFTRGSIPRPTPTNLFFPLPYRKCGHASRSQDIHPQHQHSAGQRSPSLELGPIDPRFHRPRGASLRVLPRRVAPRAHCAPTHLAEREGAQREHEREQPAPSTPGVERVPVQARHRRSGMLQ